MKVLCWLGLHQLRIRVTGQDDRERLSVVVWLTCERCQWAVNDGLTVDKATVACCEQSGGGVLCTKASGHVGRHAHPSYGSWAHA